MDPLPIPQPTALNDAKGQTTTHGYKYFQSLDQAARSTSAQIAALAARTEADTFAIKVPVNGDENVLINAPFGFTISSITSKCASGSCTATFKIAGVALGGGANSVSTTEQTVTHTSDNVVSASDDVICTISSASSCLSAIFTIVYTRT